MGCYSFLVFIGMRRSGVRAVMTLNPPMLHSGNIDSHVARAENVLHQLHAENLLAEATADFKVLLSRSPFIGLVPAKTSSISLPKQHL